VRVCSLYPDLMNIYADRGNLIMLQRRAEWRGIGFELLEACLGERLDPDAADSCPRSLSCAASGP
jgi:lipid II isoglutaminyl synthase (glutamine-hydrolysing)